MRKKLLLLSILILALAISGLCLVACGDNGDDPSNGTSLAVPKKIAVSKSGVLSWSEVEGAESYDVRVNNVEYNCKETSFDLLSVKNLPANLQFVVRVRSVKGEVTSAWSEMVKYTHVPSAMSAPKLTFENGKITWTPNELAKKVVVSVNGTVTELAATASEFDVSSLHEDSLIAVQFIGDGIYALDSEIATLNYKANIGQVCLSTPQNVKMDGYFLTFDAVPGANIYYLQDVNNAITTTRATRVDRTTVTLIKSVWASNTNGNIADSARAEVQYFAEGSGTEADPYMIGTAAELRFVQFYESIGEYKHYKFKNDIVLTPYTPAEDEIFNNFYNLGSLSGVIDGNGFKLKNSVVYFSDGYSSLFDSITASGVIKNLVIDSANWRTWTVRSNDGKMHEKGGECAILAYTNRGTIDNVTVTNSTVHADKDGAAALVAINRGTISHCTVEQSTYIYGSCEAGGFAIFNSGKITRCINKGYISGHTTVGGIAGRNNGSVTQCGNEGKISANTYAGGIVGYNFNIFDEVLLFESTISECYNNGTIEVVTYGGGIAGKNGGDGINEVGVMSYANAGIISCYNAGTIKGSGCLGGIVGDNYGYHEVETDLGVVNCYNRGELPLNTDNLKSTRAYVSFEVLGWDVEVHGAALYLYYWADGVDPGWPGVRLTKTTINYKTYYYADMSVRAEELTGVIISRHNGSATEQWDKSEDITGPFTTGNLLFTVKNLASAKPGDEIDWTATKGPSAGLVSNTPLSIGGIAGFSNMINDCYFLAASQNGRTLEAGVANGTQKNKIQINGRTVNSSACEIKNAQSLATLASTLNSYNDVWEDSENGPVLKWQRR